MYGSAAEMPGAATLWRAYRMCAGYDTIYITNPPKDDSTQQPRTTGIAKRATTIFSIAPTPRTTKYDTAITYLDSKTLVADGSWCERTCPCQNPLFHSH